MFLFLITEFELGEKTFPSHSCMIQNLESFKFDLGHSPKFTIPVCPNKIICEVKLIYH